MTTVVCTIALSPPIFDGSMFNSWDLAVRGWYELPEMVWRIYREDPKP